jgi:hypothetical protein
MQKPENFQEVIFSSGNQERTYLEMRQQLDQFILKAKNDNAFTLCLQINSQQITQYII